VRCKGCLQGDLLCSPVHGDGKVVVLIVLQGKRREGVGLEVAHPDRPVVSRWLALRVARLEVRPGKDIENVIP
jgi:hypothetical protein